MNFRQQIAKYVTGHLTIDQLPDLAVIGLEEGLDTPSLRILAGLSKSENPFQIERYFNLTLDELGLALPEKREAAILYAMAIVDEILAGNKDIITGTREICSNAIMSFDFSNESKQYCYDSIGFEAAYGLFDTLEELSIAESHRQTEKTNEQLMAETQTALFEELKKWKEKLNGVV